ncbi:MAG: DNA topoisomerase IB [Gemmatimonadetes bacterium]|nr:DNA topoisomerase IB [Gemmatimonadota bacterium]
MSERDREETGRMWRREGSPKEGFTYLRADGKPLRSPAALRRIKTLAIPPAWTDVRIAPKPTDKVQAVGHDAAGRKQYIYHSDFVQKRARRKYIRVEAFARVLPRLRTITNEHLRTKGLNRQRVLATVVRLMSRAYFRVGSERYALENQTFGLTTLRKKHLVIDENDLIFSYKGKSGVHQRRVVAETPLVEIMKQLQKLPGTRLFRYYDEDGKLRNVTAREVNTYLKEILGEKYTSKDMRTWGGTVRAAVILSDLGPAKKPREAEKNIVLACKLVSTELGNTPSVCRSAYIHPVVLERYISGRTIEPVMRQKERGVEADSPVEYYPEEAALLRFLEGRRR